MLEWFDMIRMNHQLIYAISLYDWSRSSIKPHAGACFSLELPSFKILRKRYEIWASALLYGLNISPFSTLSPLLRPQPRLSDIRKLTCIYDIVLFNFSACVTEP
jgi:hypothetical protein